MEVILPGPNSEGKKDGTRSKLGAENVIENTRRGLGETFQRLAKKNHDQCHG